MSVTLRKRRWLFMALLSVYACSSSDFVSKNAGQRKSSDKKTLAPELDDGDRSTAVEGDTPKSTPTGSASVPAGVPAGDVTSASIQPPDADSADGGPINPITGMSSIPLTDEQKDRNCWFAVSGTAIGTGGKGGGLGIATIRDQYRDVFPRTLSGKPVGPMERFDIVGGVYLPTRAEPYVYGVGHKEIDDAVKASFDGIAVAPGMHVVIKETPAGRTILDREGPYYAASTAWNPEIAHLTQSVKTNKSLPAWLRAHLSHVKIVPTLPLRDAKYVKVTAVAGKACE